MPKLSGLFDSFDNLDQIPAESVANWLKPVPQIEYIENYLATKILYPQTLPLNQADVQLDMAILREALRLNGPKRNPVNGNTLLGDNPFLNTTMRKILIPANFLKYIPDLNSLVCIFIDGLLSTREKKDFFQDLWTIVLTDNIDEVIGSLFLPQFESKSALMSLIIQNSSYQIRPGNLMFIPCPKDRCEVAYKLNQGKILGKQESAVQVYGGKLGLVIDGRSL